jgi:hypothetical protein
MHKSNRKKKKKMKYRAKLAQRRRQFAQFALLVTTMLIVEDLAYYIFWPIRAFLSQLASDLSIEYLHSMLLHKYS